MIALPMWGRFFAASTILLLVCSGQAVSQRSKKQAPLNPQEQKVIDYLVGDWGQDYSKGKLLTADPASTILFMGGG